MLILLSNKKITSDVSEIDSSDLEERQKLKI